MKQTGQSTILVTVVLGIILFNILVLIAGSTLLNQSSTNSLESTQATALAEAGLTKGLASLNATGGTYTGETETLLGLGSYSVAITTLSPTTKQIKATGYLPNKVHPKKKSTVKIQISKGVGAAFNYGIQSGEGGFALGNNSTVNGSVYSNGNITMSNNSKITGDVYVAGGTQPMSDVSSDCTGLNCGDLEFGRLSNGQLDVAQAFKPSISASLNKIALKIKKIGSPSDITVRILANSSGLPDKSKVLASGTVYANLVASNYSFVDIVFASPPDLVQGTLYWIMLDSSSNNSNYWSWSEDTLKGYGGDNPYNPVWSSDWQAKTPSWHTVNADLGFNIYLGGVSTSVIGSSNVTIGGAAHANRLEALKITGGAYYQTNQNITAGSMHPNSSDPQTQLFPISAGNINQWKTEAAANGVQIGNITNCPATLASKKYQGNITLPSNCTTTIQTPIYITGSLTLNGNDRIKLDPTFGSASGVIISDNFVNITNNNIIQGTGSSGSFLTLISDFNSKDDPTHRVAIDITNNGNTGMLYSNLGAISIGNNNSFISITAWKIILSNNVSINYDQGLSGAFFTSGPGGSFSVLKGTYQLGN